MGRVVRLSSCKVLLPLAAASTFVQGLHHDCECISFEWQQHDAFILKTYTVFKDKC